MATTQAIPIAPYTHTFNVSKAGEAQRKEQKIIPAGAQLGAAIQYMARAGTSVVLLPTGPVPSTSGHHSQSEQVPSTSTVQPLLIPVGPVPSSSGLNLYSIKINEMSTTKRAKQAI